MQKIQKTIKCKIHDLTNIKEQVLQAEYDDYQIICQEVMECVNHDFIPDRPYSLFKTPTRYSATVWGAIQSTKNRQQFINLKNQPLYLRNDVFKIDERQTKISKHWFRLPTKQKHGGVWLPIIVPKKYEELLSLKICDSKITKNRKGWFLHLVVQKEATIKNSYSDIIAIDPGIRHIASVVQLSNGKPRYYGTELRQIRGHHFHLRKELGKKKALRTIKKIKDKEQWLTNNQLHQISRDIVNWAKETDSAIVSGDLKGIRKNTEKGRKFNRKNNSFPFHKLNGYIEYKANEEGISFITVNEAYTSKTCHKCGKTLKRKGRHHGLVVCECGYNDNADRNGAINIGRRGLSSMLSSGARLTGPALTFGVCNHNHHAH